MSSNTARWRSRTFWGNFASLASLALIAAAFFALQQGDWWPAMPRADRWIGAAIALFSYLLFCAAFLWRSRTRKANDDIPNAATRDSSVLVVHASQTGFAQQLAERSAENLRNSGLTVKLRAIAEVDSAMLATAGRVLFVASTTGEGDPPDQALAFVRDVMGQPAALGRLRYAVLALGDREYEHFCGFGHQLDNWLRQHGAQSLFDIVEVDNADESALRHWQHHLGQLSGVTDLPDWTQPRYERWTLVERRELNPGSVGGGAFHLAMTPSAESVGHWVAGDIAEIGPRHSPLVVAALLGQAGIAADASVVIDGQLQSLAELLAGSHLPTLDEIRDMDAQALAETLKPLPHREYSIASLPSDGALHILLRRLLRADGTPGIGSGWLCDYAPVGGEIALRLRSNPNFHAPDPAKPMILIGNGTGIAGLRAHLKQRIAVGARRNWLLFGERNSDRDFFYRDEILHWQAQNHIERLDLAFSRDRTERVYVQQKLQAMAEVLHEWVKAGASIYVCGSLAGMAPGVDGALRRILGDANVESMLTEGRYRRDVY
ncbi:sulfite reductase flavoprotein subunit alpha [Pseudoxanthomonas sacheonensis]|uniref:NADPH--hemoprotein reductase n=1 Tax=Pseudoxanthomonas sacheonensis TaxID=443615 RepID=A0ABU1RPX4_9GAMM|nr:sulfite reductase flavoprotein subunit alpha [Pseudoxanthomonas sacheonensis]MDR6839975.1 sulfite reductase (NADPH) flavoprotein alpha-component [Pseudoxanthomonas sacheonensis]